MALNEVVNKETVKEHSKQAVGLAKSEAARNSAILFGGNFINTLLSMVAVIIVSRALGPHDFGVVATFNAILGTLVGLTEFGLSVAAVKLISENLVKSKHHANVVMRVIFFAELTAGLIVLVLGLAFSNLIANALGGPHLLFAIRMSFIAAAITSAAAFFGPFFIAHKQFVRNAIVSISGGIFKAGSIVLLLGLSLLSLRHVIIAYTLVPLFFFTIAYLFVPKGFQQKATRSEEKEAFKEVFHYSKWVFLSYIATSIAGNMDLFLISRYRGSSSVGIYTAAQQLVTVLPMLIGAITTVMLPKFSQLSKRSEYESLTRKLIFALIGIIICFIPVIIFAQIPITLIFGQRFVASITIFKILLSAYLIALFTSSLAVIIYARSRQKVLTFMNYITLVLSFLAYIVVVPKFGPIGAACVFFGSQVVGGTFVVYYAFRTIRSVPK